MLNLTLNAYNLPYPMPLHSIAVHFVIAMVVVAAVFDVVGYFSGQQRFFNLGWWNLVIATIAIILAVGLGQFEAAIAVPSQGTQPTLDRHMAIGWLLLLILINLTLWRAVLRYHPKFPFSLFFLGTSALTVALVFYQVFLGTQLVWVHGLHVKPVIEARRLEAGKLEALENELY
ncbi:MAG: DUF2231 domain-containing protein [Leptolyngbya sp. BL-A-14]